MTAATVRTVAYEAGLARVKINLSGFQAGTTGVQITRKDLDTGKTSLVRGARRVPINTPTTDTVQLYDYEYPAGHRVQYAYFQLPDTTRYVIGNERLSADAGGFEMGAGGWQNSTNGTVARSTTFARTGAWSLRLQTGAAGDAEGKLVNGNGATSDFSAAGGADFLLGFGARAGATSRTVQLVVNWYSVLGVYLGSSVVSQNDAVGSWSYASNVVTSPAGAVTWEAFVQCFAGAAGELHYYDDLTISEVAGIRTYDVTRAWLKHPLRPYLNTTVRVGSYEPFDHRLRGAAQSAVRRPVPIGGGDVRGGRRFVLTLKLDAADLAGMDDLLKVGGIWYWQTPGADVGLPAACYVQGVSAKEKIRRNPQDGARWLELTLDEVAPPDVDLTAAAVSWTSIVAAYPTWADLAAAYPTWNDLLAAVADPAEVTVS